MITLVLVLRRSIEKRSSMHTCLGNSVRHAALLREKLFTFTGLFISAHVLQFKVARAGKTLVTLRSIFFHAFRQMLLDMKQRMLQLIFEDSRSRFHWGQVHKEITFAICLSADPNALLTCLLVWILWRFWIFIVDKISFWNIRSYSRRLNFVELNPYFHLRRILTKLTIHPT